MKYHLRHTGVEGMKWGIRRYQNKDGSLTPEGKIRYAADIQNNLGKKKDNRIDTSNPDPRRWVGEDISRSKKVTDSATEISKTADSVLKGIAPTAKKGPRIDLSDMSDSELQAIIRREQLERQYDSMFNAVKEPSVSKGRQYATNILKGTTAALTVTGSVLSIALAINELKAASGK